jgi:acyl carrier protein
MGFESVEVPESFDLLLSGVIDSFGILEMISSIEDEFRIRLDLAGLDAEQITVLGALSQYVAENAEPSDLPVDGSSPHIEYDGFVSR